MTNPTCADCGTRLKPRYLADGAVWGADTLADMGRRKFGRVLCLFHYQTAMEARRDALMPQ